MAGSENRAKTEKMRRAELELKIRKRVALEEKAHRIVERLLDNPIEPDFLTDCAKFLTPEHYQDVTEERAVSHLCGYPICPNNTKDVPKQKYHISTRTNTVYDITERKNFCSDKCLKASDHYKKQIPVSPVWAREKEPMQHVTLLGNAANKGCMGHVVFNNPKAAVRQELEELEEIDRATSTYKPRTTTRQEESQTPAVIGDLAETFQNRMNELQEVDKDAQEITTEKKLSERLAEVYMLDDEDKSETGENERNGTEEESLSKDTANVSSSNINSEPKNADGNSSTVPSSVQCKTERLMQLLDKRDALEEKLKREKDKMTHAGHAIPLKYETVKCSLVGNDKCASSESVEEVPTKSIPDNVLQNIKRFEEQGKLDIDSDDEMPEQSEESSDSVPMVMSCINEMKESNTINSPPGSKTRPPSKKIPSQSSKPKPKLTPLNLIRRVLLEWKTEATVEFLSNKQRDVGDPNFEKKYEALGKTVGSRQVDEDMDDDDSDDDVERTGARVPDFREIEKETVEFDMRVKEYFKGKMTRPTEIERKTKETLGIQETEGPTKEVVLPLVDSVAQVAIRRRIVLEKLNKVLPDLLGPMGLVQRDVASELRGLVHTFNFSSKNIIMKAAEWTLMAYFLLKLISRTTPILEKVMSEKTAVDFFEILRCGVCVTEEDVQAVVVAVTT